MKVNSIVKIVLLCAAFVMVAGGLFSSELPKESPKRPKVALVLCGGGAKGAAHIGVLRILEEADVPIDMIVGTSIGGLVGGLYAMGYSASEMDTIVSKCDWKYLLSDNSYSRQDKSFAGKSLDSRYLLKVPFYGVNSKKQDSPISRLPGGLISGQNVLNFLNGLAVGFQEPMDFSDLPIPFACVATDLSTGESVVLDKGVLPTAMRATMAIPGVFSPVEIDGKMFVDGGIVNNFPVDVARNMGADIVIGVDIQNDAPAIEDLRSLPQVLNQMIGLMGNDAYKRNVMDVDILIKPDVSDYNTFSFNEVAINQLIINGKEAAKLHYGTLDTLARKLNTISILSRMHYGEEKEMRAHRDTFCFNVVELNGIDKKNEQWLKKLSGLKDGRCLSIADINKGVSILMGTRAFSSVTYTVVEQDGDEEKLVVNITKGPTNVLGLGARYDSEEAAGILVHLGVNESDLQGSKVGFTARLSYNPYGELKYSYTPMDFPKIELSYKVGGMDMDIYRSKYDQDNLSFIYHRLEMNLANIYLRNFDFKVGARYEYYDFSKVNDGIEKGYEGFYFKGRMDNKDDGYFANNGMAVEIDGAYWTSDFSDSFTPFGSVKLLIDGTVMVTRRFVVLPQLYSRVLLGDCTEVPYLNYVGGSEPGRYFSQQLPFIGMNNAIPVDNAVMIGRVDLRQRMGKNHYIYGIANYLRSGIDFGDMFSDHAHGVWGLGFKYAYNTPVGPLSFNVHWADFEHKFGIYVSLGHYF